MNTLTTKVGDEGFTRNLKNEQISKGDYSIEVLAWGDLLNCYIGRTRMLINDEDVFGQNLNRRTQENISTIMGHISFGNILPTGNIDKYAAEVLDVASQHMLEEELLEDYEMTDWLIYEGNDAQIASKYSRVFEQKFVKWCEDHNLREEMKNEIQFLNRLSDLMFYVGLYHQLTYERLNNGTV